MSRLPDLTGLAFGKWTVVREAERLKPNVARWYVRCECGTERAALGIQLRNGSSQSCGCARQETLERLRGRGAELPGEKWAPVFVKGQDEQFEASSLGRIRKTRTGYIYAQQSVKRGYKKIHMNGKGYFVHRLVARAFLPNPLNLPFINHKNCVPGDNRLENLEWCTHQQNVNHAVLNGRMISWPGSLNPVAKLAEKQVEQIRRWYGLGLRQIDLGAAFGVSQRLISLIVRREKWVHV